MYRFCKFLKYFLSFVLNRKQLAQLPDDTADADAVPEMPPDATERPRFEVDATGWLVGEGVHKIPSKRIYARLDGNGKPSSITAHWTATAHGTAKSLANRIKDLPPKNQAGSSWHVVIEADGTVYQSASFLQGTWHAGGKTAKPGYNLTSIGVEIVNLGEVRKMKGGEWRAWPFLRPGFTPGPVVKSTDVMECDGRHYHKYTEAQLDAFEDLYSALSGFVYPLSGHTLRVVGHCEIDPTRKTDPGPWFLAWAKTLEHGEG